MARRPHLKQELPAGSIPLPNDPKTSSPDVPITCAENVSDSDRTARLAYSYWEARGCQGGSAEEDWYRAESELKAKTAP